MEIKISTKQILNILYILAWIIFVGVSIEAGGYIVNTIISVVSPENVKYLWQQVDLSALFKYDKGYFIVISCITGIVAILKATLFYMIIKILHDKKLNMAQPFNRAVGRFIFNLSYLSLMIGLLSQIGAKYSKWLAGKGVQMPDISAMNFGGADVWLFMCVVLFVIAHIFKKGIEIQTENELTV